MGLILIGWVAVAAVGFVLALWSSRRVADHAMALVRATDLSPFLVGIVVMAVGTDIPEIVNSLITSAVGHGDLNVGDSVGSSLTQLTLVLGLLPFLVGSIRTDRRAIQAVGGLTVAALLFGVFLLGDGRLSRIDAAMLVLAWPAALLFSRRVSMQELPDTERTEGGRLRHGSAALAFLFFVAAGASLAVLAMIQLAEAFSVPEYLISFFGASIGTSLPELIVDVTAIRRGATGLALGDVFGSSLVDATLSLGIGPLFFPITVDAQAAVRGGLYAAVAIALVTMLFGWVRRHDRRTGLVLVVLYAASYVVLLR